MSVAIEILKTEKNQNFIIVKSALCIKTLPFLIKIVKGSYNVLNHNKIKL